MSVAYLTTNSRIYRRNADESFDELYAQAGSSTLTPYSGIMSPTNHDILVFQGGTSLGQTGLVYSNDGGVIWKNGVDDYRRQGFTGFDPTGGLIYAWCLGNNLLYPDFLNGRISKIEPLALEDIMPPAVAQEHVPNWETHKLTGPKTNARGVWVEDDYIYLTHYTTAGGFGAENMELWRYPISGAAGEQLLPVTPIWHTYEYRGLLGSGILWIWDPQDVSPRSTLYKVQTATGIISEYNTRPGRPIADIVPVDSDVAYLAISRDSFASALQLEGQIWKTIDGGETWELKLEDGDLFIDFDTDAACTPALSVSLDNPNVVFAIGKAPYYFLSEDAGATWTKFTAPVTVNQWSSVIALFLRYPGIARVPKLGTTQDLFVRTSP